MRVVIGSVVCAAALLAAPTVPAAAAVPQTTAKPSASATDARITQRLKADPALRKYDIKVSVEEGVATLRGTVATEGDRMKAAELAKVDGITRVDNQLIVDLTAGTTKGTAGTVKEKTKEGAEKTKEGVGKAAEKTKDGAKVVGQKTKEGAVKVGDEVTDAYLITKLKADFVNEDTLKGSDINVDSDNQIVTLRGTVMSEAGRTRAVEIARTTKGVKRVVDRLTIGPKK